MLHAKDFIHPEDEAALRNMESIPGFPTAVKTFLKYGYEKLYHGLNMASKIRLSPTQLPDIYNRLPPICAKLGIAEPEFYLEMNPMPNAYTFGDTQIFVVVTSGLLEYLDDDEINSVIAHECGHIACRHVLYHSMATLLIQGGDFLGVLGSLLFPIKYALLYWQRKSELSCDRAGALIMGVDSIVQTQIRLSGGPKSITQGINVDQWARQADAYEEIRDGNTWNKLLQIMATMGSSHPFAAVRVREILKWSRTDQYRRLREHAVLCDSGRVCGHCGRPVDGEWGFCKHCGHKL